MTDIVSSTGTYHWGYNFYYIPSGINHANVDPSSLSNMELNPSAATNALTLDQIITYCTANQTYNTTGDVELVSDEIMPMPDSWTPFVSTPEGSGGGELVATGTSYDTGSTQVYAYYWKTSQLLFSDSTHVRKKTYQLWLWIYYAPSSASPAIPPVTPSPVTLHLSRLTIDTYFPRVDQQGVLEKYRQGVKEIRAKFQTTRTAVIKGNNLGGFIIYEEVAGNPSGNCYVYDSERTLKAVVLPADLYQYLL